MCLLGEGIHGGTVRAIFSKIVGATLSAVNGTYVFAEYMT